MRRGAETFKERSIKASFASRLDLVTAEMINAADSPVNRGGALLPCLPAIQRTV